MNERGYILGIPIDFLSLKEVKDKIFFYLDSCKEKNRRNHPLYIATVNVDFLNQTYTPFQNHPKNPELLDVLRNSFIATPDGMPIAFYQTIVYGKSIERVTGADLLPEIVQEAAKKGKTLFFLGGEKKISQKAIDLLKNRFPKLNVVGFESPNISIDPKDPKAFLEDQKIIESINQKKPDILILALGNPKQELFFHRIQSKIDAKIVIGLGGTLNFLAGRVKRAPIWVQKSGLEWIYRLYQEPKRLWRRYVFGSLNFLGLIFPLFFHQIYLLVMYLKRASILKKKGMENLLFQSKDNSLLLVNDFTEKKLEKADLVILNFKDIDFLKKEMIDLFFNQKNCICMNLSKSLLSKMKKERLLDLVRIYDSKSFSKLYFSRSSDTLFFFGTLTIHSLQEIYEDITSFMQQGQKVSLQYLSYYEHGALQFLSHQFKIKII